MNKAILLLVAALLIYGCASISCNSQGLQPGQQAYAAFGGSEVGNTAMAFAQTAGGAALGLPGGVKGPKGPGGTVPNATAPGCSVTYNVPPIFGSDYIATGITQPSAVPSPVIVAVPNGAPSPVVLLPK